MATELQPQSVATGAATAHGVAQAVAVSQQLLRRASNRVRVAGAQDVLATEVSQQADVAAQPQAGAGVQHGAGAGVQQVAGWQQELRRAKTRTRLLRAQGSQLEAVAHGSQLETVPHVPQPEATADEPQLVQP